MIRKISMLWVIGCSALWAQGDLDYFDALGKAGISKSDWQRLSSFDKLNQAYWVRANPGQKAQLPAARPTGAFYAEPFAGVSLVQAPTTNQPQPEARSFTRFNSMTEDILQQQYGTKGLAQWKQRPFAEQQAEAQRIWASQHKQIANVVPLSPGSVGIMQRPPAVPVQKPANTNAPHGSPLQKKINPVATRTRPKQVARPAPKRRQMPPAKKQTRTGE